MGDAIPLIVIFALVVLAILVGAAVLGRAVGRREDRMLDAAKDPEVETLRYTVPLGQDPAAVVAALRLEGYEASRDPEATSQDVLIPCLEGKERHRARVRATIAGARHNLEESDDLGTEPGSVRFADE